MLRRTPSVGVATARATGAPTILGWGEGCVVVAGRAAARTWTVTTWAIEAELDDRGVPHHEIDLFGLPTKVVLAAGEVESV